MNKLDTWFQAHMPRHEAIMIPTLLGDVVITNRRCLLLLFFRKCSICFHCVTSFFKRWPLPYDSYMSVDWKSMKLIAIKQAQIIKKYESNNIIEKKKNEKIPENSEHPIPGLSHYLDFMKKK